MYDDEKARKCRLSHHKVKTKRAKGGRGRRLYDFYVECEKCIFYETDKCVLTKEKES